MQVADWEFQINFVHCWAHRSQLAAERCWHTVILWWVCLYCENIQVSQSTNIPVDVALCRVSNIIRMRKRPCRHMAWLQWQWRWRHWHNKYVNSSKPNVICGRCLAVVYRYRFTSSLRLFGSSNFLFYFCCCFVSEVWLSALRLNLVELIFGCWSSTLVNRSVATFESIMARLDEKEK